MQCINIDTIGPIPADSEGYAYILVVIDTFTRFVGLYALKDTSAEQAVLAILQHIGLFGCPAEIKTDNGSQFSNQLMQEIISLLGTRHALTLAYSKEENAIVERSNKEVMRYIRAFAFEFNNHERWRRDLPFANRIMNSSIHESIGVSPAQLLFGNAVNLDQGIFLPIPQTMLDADVALSTITSDMLNMQNKLLLKAAQLQSDRNHHHLQSRPADVTEFPVNSFVLSDYPDNPLGLRKAPTKLHTLLKGPLRVVTNVGSDYTLLNLATNKLEHHHVKQLRQFRYDPTRVNPVDIANRDYQLFNVARIIAHAGDPTRKSSLDFLVRWEGYDAANDLWLPWKELRDNVKLHDYCRAIPALRKLLPVALR
jgi:hypothetical protein